MPDPNEADPGIRAQAAVKLTSWNDYRLIFGGFLPYSYLAYAVRGFFATGGETCYVVRVGVSKTPPATALLPLPAAITSTQIATLAATAAAGAAEIQLDASVQLAAGSTIAIGDPAYNQLLIVTGIGAAQSLTVSDATQTGAGLSSQQNAGTPVFALSGPAVATPITSIATATAEGATQIQLGSSDVIGIAPGSLIAIGDPVSGECVSVESVVDDQTVTLQPALISVYAAGVPVYPVAGSALAAAAAASDTSLQVGDASAFAQDDLVGVEGGGVTKIRVVTAPPTGSTIQLGLPLGYAFAAGTVVRRYTSAFTVNALSPGAWGNRIKLTIAPLDPGNATTHFSMLVTVDPGADPVQPVQQEFYPLLSLDPNDPSPTPIYAPSVVNAASELIQICPSAASICPAQPAAITMGTQLLVGGGGPFATLSLYLEGGSDGTPIAAPAAPAPPVPDPCSGPAAPPASSASQPYPSPPGACDRDFLDALDVLGLVDEIAILCCPDAAGPPPQTPAATSWHMSAIQQAMVDQCVQLQYRVAVLDTPMSQRPGGPPLNPAEALSWLNGQAYADPAARFAAVYYPWLEVPDELGIEGPNRTVPPCGHVAGAYAYTDNTSGVQKPPANVELQFVSDVQLAVTNQQQGFLNPAGINCIRPFAGRGIRVWGARSLSQNPWTYIHTRRLMSMIENSVEQASRWTVFQTNDDNLRRMLTHSLNVFLRSIWLAGGLQGSVPTDGYYVKCDSTNNTPATIDAGQLICQVGVAIAAPMEFLVFEMRRSVAGAQVVEA